MRAGALRLRLTPPRRRACAPVVVRGVERQRAAVRIALCDGQGGRGLGEALPLPGYSRDDAQAAERALAALAAAAAEIVVPGDAGQGAAARIAAALAPQAAALAACPSARFALECALADVLSRRGGVSAAAWLADGRPLHPVPVSVLLPEDAASAAAAAGDAAARGHAVVKIKVGVAGRSEAEEEALLAGVRAACEAIAPGRVRLRLDANGVLDPARVVERCAALARHGVECIEEPVSGPALLDLPPLPLPWAADESLADPALAAALLALPAPRRPAALVLKPAELGIVRCLALAADAARAGLGVVVTHSFDGDIGFAAACAVAAALPQPPWPCGLAPHAGLSRPAPPSPWLPPPPGPGLGVETDTGEFP